MMEFLIFMVVMGLIVVGIAVFQNWNHKENQRMLDDFPYDGEVQRKYAPLVGKKPFQNLHSEPNYKLCKNHGGDGDVNDAFFACDVCARSEINPCDCGSPARYFGEALMCSVSCEVCDAFLMDVGEDLNIRERWNNGERGVIGDFGGVSIDNNN